MDITTFSTETTGLLFPRSMSVKISDWLDLLVKAKILRSSFLAEQVQGAGPPLINSTCPDCGLLSAYFPTNKSIAWSFLTGDIVGSVALADGIVFFGTQNGNFYGISTSNGDVLFNSSLPVGIWGGVTVADGYLITGTSASSPSISNGAALGVYAYSLNPSVSTTFSSSTSVTSSSSTRSSTSQTIPVVWALAAVSITLIVGVLLGFLVRKSSNYEKKESDASIRNVLKVGVGLAAALAQ